MGIVDGWTAKSLRPSTLCRGELSDCQKVRQFREDILRTAWKSCLVLILFTRQIDVRT